jgi:Mrp family chromosome partitioning ATPase
MSNLAQKLAQFMRTDGFRLFHFTASREREGVSSVVAGLARFMAGEESSASVLVIDANFSAPAQHAIFGTPASPGLRDALLGRSASDCTHPTWSNGIRVMPNGTGEIDVTGSAGQGRLASLLSSLRADYDCVIIDSPPLLSSGDSSSLAACSDVTFLVVEANRTLWEVAQKSKITLEKNGCRIGGVVLNRVVHFIPKWLYGRI